MKRSPWGSARRDDILPQLPASYQVALEAKLKRADGDATGGTRSHPHFHRAPHFPTQRGVIAIGDHGNGRHPLTGGGMTCAMRDSFHLAEALAGIPDLAETERVHAAVQRFLNRRPFFTTVINVLSFALHGVFGGPKAMRDACFRYFRGGGDCGSVPVAFLAGTDSSLSALVHHYSRVMWFGVKDICRSPSLWKFLVFLASPARALGALHLLGSGRHVPLHAHAHPRPRRPVAPHRPHQAVVNNKGKWKSEYREKTIAPLQGLSRQQSVTSRERLLCVFSVPVLRCYRFPVC